MPHSTALEPMLSGGSVEEDSILPDAPVQAPNPDGKMDRTEGTSQSEDSTGEAPRTDVKLEDLFNDFNDDEDDEFSDSRISDTNNKSSPTGAPL